MLPLVYKTVNINGFTDYVDGLDPDIEQSEDYANLGVLGNVNEPLIAAALNDIFGLPQPQPLRSIQFEEISESKVFMPTYQLMVDNN